MSTTPTTNLNLIKNNADEPIANWRTNDNANMNALDTAIKAVQDATDTLEKARQNLNNLIGVLGKNSSNADLISKAQARANLDVAQSGGAAKTLYADEQTIAQNASLIASLQDSVSPSKMIRLSGAKDATFSLEAERIGFFFGTSSPQVVNGTSYDIFSIIFALSSGRIFMQGRRSGTSTWDQLSYHDKD